MNRNNTEALLSLIPSFYFSTVNFDPQVSPKIHNPQSVY